MGNLALLKSQLPGAQDEKSHFFSAITPIAYSALVFRFGYSRRGRPTTDHDHLSLPAGIVFFARAPHAAKSPGLAFYQPVSALDRLHNTEKTAGAQYAEKITVRARPASQDPWRGTAVSPRATSDALWEHRSKRTDPG